LHIIGVFICTGLYSLVKKLIIDEFAGFTFFQTTDETKEQLELLTKELTKLKREQRKKQKEKK
jgi:hypothetical protein